MDSRSYAAVMKTAWTIATAIRTIDLEELAQCAERQGTPLDRALVAVLLDALPRLPRRPGDHEP
jgi:hypothetical protein